MNLQNRPIWSQWTHKRRANKRAATAWSNLVSAGILNYNLKCTVKD